MEELHNELKKLGATVVLTPFGDTEVNGQRITVEAKEKGGKVRYEVGYSGKKCANAKNAAYYILTEYLPSIARLLEMRKVKEKLQAILPADSQFYMMSDGEFRLKVRDAEQLKEVLKLFAANL